MACPTAAGLGALVHSRNPALTPAQVQSCLQSTADDLGGTGRDDYFGWGRINASRALKPSITSLSTPSAAAGTPVTINGTFFGTSLGSSSVKFGTKTCASTDYVSWSDTQIVAKVPASAYGVAPVTVTTTAGGTSNAVSFGVLPKMTAMSSYSGTTAETRTMAGSAFGPSQGTSAVYFGNTKATSYSLWSNTKISVKVPVGASGQTSVTVKTATGTSNSKTFKVVPKITACFPTATSTNSTLTIGGNAFGSSRGTSAVYFGSVKAATYTTWSNVKIRVKVPSGFTGTVPVKVVTGGGTSNTVSFRKTGGS
jgi:hypothetical protein